MSAVIIAQGQLCPVCNVARDYHWHLDAKARNGISAARRARGSPTLKGKQQSPELIAKRMVGRRRWYATHSSPLKGYSIPKDSAWYKKLSLRFFGSGQLAVRIGSANGNWKGGLSFQPYAPEFNSALKAQVKQRDKEQCQLCGAFNNKYTQGHNVHHIDYNKLNTSLSNLVLLCHSCNGKVNRNRLYWAEYFSRLLCVRKPTIQLTLPLRWPRKQARRYHWSEEAKRRYSLAKKKYKPLETASILQLYNDRTLSLNETASALGTTPYYLWSEMIRLGIERRSRHSERTRHKIADSLRGRKNGPRSEETKQKIRHAWITKAERGIIG